MSECGAWEGECPGCRCFIAPPCTHCVDHLDEDGVPLVIHRDDVADEDGAVDPRRVFAHPAPLARDIPIWIAPYGPDHPRMRSFTDLMQEMLVDADLSVNVELWYRRVDYLTEPGWWHWRPPCACPSTGTFGRYPHRWDCELTPIWAQTVRDYDARALTGDARGSLYLKWDPLHALRDPNSVGFVKVGKLEGGAP